MKDYSPQAAPVWHVDDYEVKASNSMAKRNFCLPLNYLEEYELGALHIIKDYQRSLFLAYLYGRANEASKDQLILLQKDGQNLDLLILLINLLCAQLEKANYQIRQNE